ncbi:MAG: NAD(P)/FAD-dependent oxidoreductase, partial [Nocardiopsaceae bacterium]|nr:NAD(P)/FAD-dependent oxidoreductase [Nocardiopsaceae bacterium]
MTEDTVVGETPAGGSAAEHVDVLIVGAGLSGIGAARHIQSAFPGRTFVICEARDALGGTWDLFRYPGVRSDSDMHTLGYRFRPWTQDSSIVDGPSILRYLQDTAAETGIDKRIRFGHRVTRAAWSSAEARWTVTAVAGGKPVTFTARFLYGCTGYYRYDHGHEPSFPGIEDFEGTVVHPQHWPSDLDYSGKKVVVIGSGATAITLVPAMTDKAAHVTMLQRSPTYITSLPEVDPVYTLLGKLVGKRRAYPVIRWKNVAVQTLFYQLCQRHPDLGRSLLRRMAIRQLPPGYPVDTHFKPRYNPWDQRLCVVPDGDLFRAIREGKASVVTDRVASFTPGGIRLESGEELDADVVVTATGLKLLAFGDMALSVDGADVNPPETMAYKGMMISGVPNFAFTIGYVNASWTLKADLVSEYVVRLLRHMDAGGYDSCVPVADSSVEVRPLLDFSAGYVQRSVHEFPKAGARAPWQVLMSYPYDLLKLRFGKVDDGVLRFTRRAVAPSEPTPASSAESAPAPAPASAPA